MKTKSSLCPDNLRVLLIIVILLIPVTLGLNLKPVAATVTVSNMNMTCPYAMGSGNPNRAREGDSVDVKLSGDVQYDVTPTLVFKLIQLSDGASLGYSDVDEGAQLNPGGSVSETFRMDMSVQVPTAPNPPGWNGNQYVWNLEADLSDNKTQTPLGTRQCSITVIKADADPWVKVDQGNAWYMHGFGSPPSLNVGEWDTMVVTYDYSAPLGSSFSIRYWNSLGLYSSLPYNPRDIPGADGWVEHQIAGQGGEGPGGYSIPVVAPLVSTNDWLWKVEVHVATLDGRSASDAASVNVTVSDRDKNWAAFMDVSVPSHAPPSSPVQVVLSGVYAFPAGHSGDLVIGIGDDSACETGHPNTPCGESGWIPGLIAGGGNQTLGPYSGSGIFTQTFTITSPDSGWRNPSGFPEVELIASLWISEVSGPVDYSVFFLVVGGDGPDNYCKITNVEVNGGALPQNVPHGQPFSVNIDVSWFLNASQASVVDRKCEGTVWDWDQLVQVIGSNDLPVTADGAGSGTVSVQMPANSVPARDGNWTLRAVVSYHVSTSDPFEYSPSDYERVFNVTVGGVSTASSSSWPSSTAASATGTPTGGASDWAVTGTSLSQGAPFLGTDVTFLAQIGVTTSNPLPQTVTVSYSLDGGPPVNDSLTYQQGLAFLEVSSKPWTPTLGDHVISWVVDPDQQYADPNRANNAMNLKFTVSQAPPQPQPQPPPPSTVTPPPTAEEFDYYVTATPTEQTVQSPAIYKVTVNVTAGTPQPVQLDLVGVPAGVSYFFSPTSGTPSYASTLTITTPTSLPAGSYDLTINATSMGKARYKSLVLDVEKGPDYALSITPATVHARPGEKAQFSVTVSSNSSYNQFVNLRVSGLPDGVTSQLQPNAAVPTSQSTMSLQLGEDVVPGFYRITVIGSGPTEKSATVTLLVENASVAVGASRENTVNYLAASILGLIVAIAVLGVVVAARRLRTRRLKVFCIECRTKIPADLDYCPKCGTKQPRSTQN